MRKHWNNVRKSQQGATNDSEKKTSTRRQTSYIQSSGSCLFELLVDGNGQHPRLNTSDASGF